LLPDFYSGATGLSGCFVRDFLSGALTLFSAIESGLFTELAKEPLDAAEIQKRCTRKLSY
jgi:hypothetical protein